MSKAWNEMDDTEKMSVLESLAKIYEEAEYPKGLKNPTWSSEYVNILMAKEKQVQEGSITIKGGFSNDKKELADKLKTQFTEALKDVKGAQVEISCAMQVGS